MIQEEIGLLEEVTRGKSLRFYIWKIVLAVCAFPLYHQTSTIAECIVGRHTVPTHPHPPTPTHSKSLLDPPYLSNKAARTQISTQFHKKEMKSIKLSNVVKYNSAVKERTKHTCFASNWSCSIDSRWCNLLNLLIFSWSSRRTSVSSPPVATSSSFESWGEGGVG